MGRRSLHLLAAWVGSVLCCCTASAQGGPSLKSGLYEGLLLAVDRDGQVTGYFREQQGVGIVKTCTFYLAGKLDGSSAIPIITWNVMAFSGTISVKAEGVELAVPHASEHPGCGLVLPQQIANGMELDRTRPADWTSLARVTVPRAHLHAAPPQATEQRAYLVQGNVVGILSRSGPWLQIQYLDDDAKVTAGWILADQTAPLKPPD